MSTSAPVVIGGSFTASIPTPPGPPVGLGARVEMPATGAVVGSWQPAAIGTSITTVVLDAPLTAGVYLVHWMTSTAPSTYDAYVPVTVVAVDDASIPSVEWPPVDVAQVRPEVDDVARLERSRTVEDGGSEAGTFTARTRPTATEVEDLIDQAVDDVLSQMRERIDPAHYRQVKRIVVYYAAMLVEGSFYREQVNERGAPLWQAEYREALAALNERVEQDIAQNNLLGTMEPRSSLLA